MEPNPSITSLYHCRLPQRLVPSPRDPRRPSTCLTGENPCVPRGEKALPPPTIRLEALLDSPQLMPPELKVCMELWCRKNEQLGTGRAEPPRTWLLQCPLASAGFASFGITSEVQCRWGLGMRFDASNLGFRHSRYTTAFNRFNPSLSREISVPDSVVESPKLPTKLNRFNAKAKKIRPSSGSSFLLYIELLPFPSNFPSWAC